MHGGNVWQGNGPETWLDYSANIRPEGAPEWVRAALQRAMDDVRYYPDPQMKRARSAMARYLNLPEENVLPTAGGISAIDMAARLSKRALLTTPCFEEYENQCREHGAQIEKVSLLDGHALLDPAERVGTRIPEGGLVWLCNPMNPVGAAFARERVEVLLNCVEAKNAYLAVDEAFIEYCPERSVRDLVPTRERLIVTGSMTKILGVPGVRLGYLCAPKRVIDALSAHQITWELNCFAASVACALPEHAADIDADAAENALRRAELREALERLGAFVYPSEASFLLADFGRSVAPISDALRRRGILTRSCMSFDGLDDGRHLRLAVKDEKSNATLAAALQEVLSCAENR